MAFCTSQCVAVWQRLTLVVICILGSHYVKKCRCFTLDVCHLAAPPPRNLKHLPGFFKRSCIPTTALKSDSTAGTGSSDNEEGSKSLATLPRPGGLPFERGVNRVTLLGRIGQDPLVRHIQQNDLIFAHFSLVTGSTYRHKVTNELIRRNQWHRIVVFDPFAISLCQNFLRKGSRVYIEGELCTRKYVDRNTGEARAITEVVLPKFNSVINLIQNPRQGEKLPVTDDELEDEEADDFEEDEEEIEDEHPGGEG